MGANKTMFAFMSLMTAATILLHAQDKKIIDTKNMLLSEIAAKIGEYKNKTVTLRLKFKYADRIFEKISFYDRKNNDIIFDIVELKKTNQFKKEVQNLHQGLEYNVTFIVKNVTKYGIIMGDLLGFQPVILSKLPVL